MPKTTTLFIALGTAFLSACSLGHAREGRRCEVTQIEEVASDPLAHAGHVFCGIVYAVQEGAGARLLQRRDEVPTLYNLAFLVTTRTEPLLQGLSTSPQQYYVEARVDPHRECFVPSGSGEECSPWVRPVAMHLRVARRTQ